MFPRSTIVSIFILAVSTYVSAANKVIIIGGGPYPAESQASIEINTKWIIDVINQHTSAKITDILYTDGNKPGVDVYKHVENNPDILLYEPLARVYGKQRENSEVFYSSKIENNIGPITHASVVNALNTGFSSLGSGDALFLIFQGHGNANLKNPNANYFYLLGDDKLTVSELGKLISHAPQDSTIRFLFPQCYSGAFTNLMYKEQNSKNSLTKANICGFTAQRNDLPSEGCTPSVNTDTYRDYSSYLFSAISGKTIDGKPLSGNPDLNHDGHVSLREAHLYTLGHAFSVDYSRSTSEDYLEHWLPWYLKWIPNSSEPDNEYMRIASEIAAKNNLNGKGNTLIQGVNAKMSQLDSELEKIEGARRDLAGAIKSAQSSIKKDLSRQWPQLDLPYTAQYSQLLHHKLNEINLYIKNHKSYPDLVKNQNKDAVLETRFLNTRRELAQMLKILRMRKLGRTLELFNSYASDSQKAEYRRLLNCEDTRI
ncbi:MAG: hypothetical protein GC149_15225 [Gammaproteobacteria bacterium]|nr:hypothetical protein [Gammaproteobacteria bacterium]